MVPDLLVTAAELFILAYVIVMIWKQIDKEIHISEWFRGKLESRANKVLTELLPEEVDEE